MEYHPESSPATSDLPSQSEEEEHEPGTLDARRRGCLSAMQGLRDVCVPGEQVELRLITDASDWGMGGVIKQQSPSGSWKSLGFFSCKFKDSQLKYSTYDRELTMIFEAIQYFYHYAAGREFMVDTDQRRRALSYALMESYETASLRCQCQIAYID